jgi:hypothetical protein
MSTISASPCDVTPEVREADNAAAWRAVCELRADFLVDAPRPDEPPYIPSGPYRDDFDDFLPSATDDEWRAQQLAAERPDLVTWLGDQSDNYRYIEASVHGEWLAAQIDRLMEQARFFGATTGEDFDDRRCAMLAEVSRDAGDR